MLAALPLLCPLALQQEGLSLDSFVVDDSFLGASAVTAADLDGDGRTDLAAAGYYQDSFSWWGNPGAGAWQRREILSLNGAYVLDAADLDLDGDVDLYGSSRTTSAFGEDTVWWFENRLESAGGGPPSFTAHFVHNLDNGDPHSVDAADFDGDGTTDLAVAYVYDPNIHLFPNADGTGQQLGAQITPLFVPGVNGVSVVRGEDFDNDGDVDVLATTAWDWVGDNNYYWFENRGGAYMPLVTMAGGLEYNGAFDLDTGDLDGDGLADLVTSADGSYGNPVLRWVRRLDGAGITWSQGLVVDPQFFGGDGDQCIHLADLDADGDLDILGGSFLNSPKVRLWLNAGHGRFRGADVEVGFNAHGVTSADLDGDGQLEIVGASWGVCCYTGEIKIWGL